MNEEQLRVLNSLRHDELELQGRTFDQIDSKTGIALGFLFVAVGQMLSSLVSIAGKTPDLLKRLPCGVRELGDLTALAALGALAFGVASRWPSTFHYDIGLTDGHPGETNEELLERLLKDSKDCIQKNHRALRTKGNLATWTYVFTALTLLAYISLAIFGFHHLARN
jgi:hypothetical protein